jgi:tetratricopeptide (TPR) repeat protein
LVTWFLLPFALLYPILKWFVSVVLVTLLLSLLAAYITGSYNLTTLKPTAKFIDDQRNFLLLAMGLCLILFFWARFGHMQRANKRRLRAAFRLCSRAEELNLSDLGFRKSCPHDHEGQEPHREERPFFGTYFLRKMIEDTDSTDEDADMKREFTEKDLQQLIRDGRGFIFLDHLYAGKTLTLFHVVRRLRGYIVVSPDDSQPVPDKSTFALLRRRKVVIIVDNIAPLALSNYNLELFVQRVAEGTKRRYAVVGTCRDGGDYTAVVAGHGNHVTRFFERLPKIRLCPLTSAARIKLAATAGITLDGNDVRKFPHPGDITMRARTRVMKERFRNLSEPGKDSLRALKLLDVSGIPLTVQRLQSVLRVVFRRKIDQNSTEVILRNLWEQFFLLEQPTRQTIRPHFGYLVYAVSYSEGHDPDEERWDNLAQALEKDRDVEALLYLAHGHRQRGDFIRSLQVFDGILSVDPEHAIASFNKGYTLARLGKFEEALKANARALELQPDFAEAHNNRSYILSCCGELSSALNAVQRALELRPDYDDAHTNRAIVLARLRRFKESAQEFSTALGLRPKSYYAYMNMGITLSRQGAFDEALIAYKKALKLRPEYPEAYFNRGITLARMDRFEDSLADFDSAIKLNPDYAEAYMKRGQTLANLKRYPEAVQSLNRAIELKRNYALAYVNRARTFSHMGLEYREAASRDWQTASALGAVPEEKNLVLGVSLARQGAFDDALVIFDRAIELRPDYAEAYMNRAITLARMERFEESLADFDRAIELRPDYAEAYMNRGQTRMALP